MSRHRCTKELYKVFLQANSVRWYSGLALSDVSPIAISHDAVSRRLNDKCFRLRELWQIASEHINCSGLCLLIADDTVLAKPKYLGISKK